MNLHDFGIDGRLASAILDSGISPYIFEKMLSRSIKDGENVCAKVSLETGREAVVLLPALQWIVSAHGEERRRVLVVSPDRGSCDTFAEAALRLGRGVGVDTCLIEPADPMPEGPRSVTVQGAPGAAVVVGVPEALLAASAQGILNLRDFKYLVVDGTDQLADRSSDLMRRLGTLLLPSWERKSVLVCERLTLKAKNLAWDLADNPAEISIDGEVAKAQSVEKQTWRVDAESKFRFLLGRITAERPSRVCVFCNLRDSAEELSKRLAANGIRSDYILGALAIDRKRAVLDKIETGRCSVLVLTDKGAEGLPHGRFPLVVNYDFPLEPELFVKRLEMLDRSASGAKVVSIVCDRYIYGLPAVEQYIDAKLDAAPVDASMLDVEDMSAGMVFERRPPEHGRAGHNDRRVFRGGGQDVRSRESGERRDSISREDRGPDIRRSISEATGGSLDIGIGGAPRRDVSSKTKTAAEEGVRSPSPIRNREAHKDRKPVGANKREAAAPFPTKADAHEGRTLSNPYAMPMEERMKHYREKYARYLAGACNRNDSLSSRERDKRSEGAGEEKNASHPRRDSSG
jgi:ATP-dependent RNA helicase RhlB